MTVHRARVLIIWLGCVLLCGLYRAGARPLYLRLVGIFAGPSHARAAIIGRSASRRPRLPPDPHCDRARRSRRQNAGVAEPGRAAAQRSGIFQRQQRRSDRWPAGSRVFVSQPLFAQRIGHGATIYRLRTCRGDSRDHREFGLAGRLAVQIAAAAGPYRGAAEHHRSVGALARAAKPRRRLGIGGRQPRAGGRADRGKWLRQRCTGASAIQAIPGRVCGGGRGRSRRKGSAAACNCA